MTGIYSIYDSNGRISVGKQATMALSDMRVGQSGILEAVQLPEKVSDHLAHLGFLPGANVEVLRRAPAGDPTVYRIDGVEVALRAETARHIIVELATALSGKK